MVKVRGLFKMRIHIGKYVDIFPSRIQLSIWEFDESAGRYMRTENRWTKHDCSVKDFYIWNLK